jgi:hypothetical protein
MRKMPTGAACIAVQMLMSLCSSPRGAWISFTIFAVIFNFVFILLSGSTLKIGNSEITLPAVPVVTAFFIAAGLLSLRKIVSLLSF